MGNGILNNLKIKKMLRIKGNNLRVGGNLIANEITVRSSYTTRFGVKSSEGKIFLWIENLAYNSLLYEKSGELAMTVKIDKLNIEKVEILDGDKIDYLYVNEIVKKYMVEEMKISESEISII